MFFIIVLGFLALCVFAVYKLFANRRNVSTDKKVSDVSIHFPQHSLAIIAILLASFHFFIYDIIVSSFSTTPVLGLALFNVAALISLAILFRDRLKIQPVILVPMVLSSILGFMSVLRANGFVQGVNTFSIVLIFWFLLLLFNSETLRSQGLWLLNKMIAIIPKWVFQLFRLSDRSNLQSEKIALSLQSLLKTTVITGIIVLVFTVLLMNADPVFSDRISSIFDQIVGRVAASIVFVAAVASIISLKIRYQEEEKEPISFFGIHDLLIPMIAVAGLFGFFIAIQLQYLFAGKGDLSTLNLTYSEYVRKGFLELLVTAFLGGFFVYLAAVKSRFAQARTGVKWLLVSSGIVVAELFFLLASALKRDLMYVDVYGLTRVRVVGGLFIAWLAIVFLGLIAFLFIKKYKEKTFLSTLVIVSALVVLTLNIVNIDQFVITGKPAHHTYTDHFYIANLSEDSAEGWKATIESIVQDTNELIQKPTLTEVERSQLAGLKLALISLQEQRQQLYIQYAPTSELLENKHAFNIYTNYDEPSKLPKYLADKRLWQNYNYSQAQAYYLLTNDKALYIDTVDRTLAQIKAYQTEKFLSLYEEERRLLFDFSYPFISIGLNYYPEDIYSLQNQQYREPYSSVVTPDASPAVQSTVELDALLRDTCLLEPGTVFTKSAWVQKASSRAYLISQTSDIENGPSTRVILAEQINQTTFDANLPGYKVISLKSSIKCDAPVIVAGE